MNEIAVAQLNTLTSPTVIDVREPDEYESGHVDGAILIPLGSLQDRLAEVPDVTGGIMEWMQAGLPVTIGMKP